MKRLVKEFKFTVPAEHPEAGTEIVKSFEYDVCENESEALDAISQKKNVSVLSLVNDYLKGSARANAYQNALAPYRKSEVEPDDIKERMIRDYIRLGIPEDTARAQVEGLLAAKAGA